MAQGGSNPSGWNKFSGYSRAKYQEEEVKEQDRRAVEIDQTKRKHTFIHTHMYIHTYIHTYIHAHVTCAHVSSDISRQIKDSNNKTKTALSNS